MSWKAIGIFDSGVGGLTVLREIIRTLPQEDTVYLGDTARVPYGTKSPETVIRFARQITSFLVSRDIKLLVVACNTASAVSLEALQAEFAIPIVGVIEPGAVQAAAVTRSGKVGVICNAVPWNAPFAWLAAGWQDLKRTPRLTLTYGLIIFAVSWAVSLLLVSVIWASCVRSSTTE